MVAPAFRRKGLLRLSWPLLLVTVFTLLATLGNVILLSMASPELNAAVATGNQVLGIVYDISVVFSLGGLVVIAQLLGAGEFGAAGRSATLALRAALVLGVVLAAGIAALAPVLVDAVRTPPELVADAVTYLLVVAGGLFFNAYVVTASAVLRAYGRTVALLVLGVLVNVLDVGLLAVCLLVLDLGVVGAALPTLVVRGAGMLLLWWLVRRATGVRVFGRLPAGVPGQAGPARMAALSLPTVVENAVYNGAIVFAVTMLNPLGTDTINARSYALTLTALVTGVILALAQGNETIVGWDVGEGRRAAARRLTLRTAGWTAASAAVLTLALWAGADTLLSLFGPNEQVLAQARGALLISVVLLPLSAATAVLYGALRSASDVTMPMVYSVASSALVLVPLSWLLVGVVGLGLAGAFWALVAAEAVKAALLLGRWLAGSRS
ncbi:MAG: MATE family efflux transporter [Propioniciclava sp.]|uniref:MATE family efflux transporter n=1 Tax=Propioniciclava sp. TaxID=2038686 RepID=UPI0039E59C9C